MRPGARFVRIERARLPLAHAARAGRAKVRGGSELTRRSAREYAFGEDRGAPARWERARRLSRTALARRELGQRESHRGFEFLQCPLGCGLARACRAGPQAALRQVKAVVPASRINPRKTKSGRGL